VILAIACLVVRPFTVLALRPIAYVFALLFGAVGRLAASELRRSPQRVEGAIRLVAVGLGIVMWLSTVGRSVEESLVRIMTGSRRTELIVASAFDLGSDMAALGEEIADQIAAVPGVSAVSAERALYDEAVGVTTFDAAHFHDPRFAQWTFDGPTTPDALARVARGEALFVTPGFATHHRVGIGDAVRLATPSGTLSLPIAGITSTAVYSRTGDVTLVRSVFRRWWKDMAVTRVFVVVAEGASPGELREAILRTFGRTHRLRVFFAADLAEHYRSMVRQSAVLLQAVAVLALVVVALGLADTLLAGVLARTRDFGTMRALGASPSSVRGVVLLEAAAIMTLGLGLAFGLALMLSLVLLHFVMLSILGWQQRVVVDMPIVVAAIAGGGIAALAGAMLPARWASRVAPATALRLE
jgi:putative ABC transport system permease protein